MSEKVQLTVSGIKEDLNQGLTRVDIQTKYGLPPRDVTALFKHPKLKGLKTKPAPMFILTDDTSEEEVTETPVVDNGDQEMQTPSVDNDFSTETPVEPVVTDEF